MTRFRILQDQRKEGLGTSGTLGFTKKNELFVGRMAMIGIAVRLLLSHLLPVPRHEDPCCAPPSPSISSSGAS